MTKDQVIDWIESICNQFPERASGNEINAFIAKEIVPLIATDRSAVVEALRAWIALRIPQNERRPSDGIREAKLWMALVIAADNQLYELRDDMESLLADVRSGKTFLPYYEEMILRLLKKMTRQAESLKSIN